MGIPHSAPASPQRMAWSLGEPLCPRRAAPHPRISAPRHASREGSAFICVEKPLTRPLPRVPPRRVARDWRWGSRWAVGAPGGRLGQEAWRAASPWPLGGSWAILGATPAPGRAAPPRRGARGAGEGRVVFCAVGRPGPSQRQGSRPWPPRRRPPGLRPMLGRGAPASLEIRALGIPISNAAFGAASTARHRRHRRHRRRRRRGARTTASVCSVFSLWGSLARGLPAGLLGARAASLHDRPCMLLSVPPRRPPHPAGPTHRADFFLSFFHPRAAAPNPRIP